VAVGRSLRVTHGTVKIEANGDFSYALDTAGPAVQALGPGETLVDTVRYTAAGGGFSDEAVVRVTNPDGSFTFTPDAGFAGTAVFSYTATDSDGASATGRVEVAVLAANTPPVTVAEDSTLTAAAGALLANDTDAEDDALTAELVDGPANGTATVAADGSFTYTPATDFNGTDSFTHRSFDGSLYGDPATVSITVTPVNDAPVAVDDSFTIAENERVFDGPNPFTVYGITFNHTSLLANDSDIDTPIAITPEAIALAGATANPVAPELVGPVPPGLRFAAQPGDLYGFAGVSGSIDFVPSVELSLGDALSGDGAMVNAGETVLVAAALDAGDNPVDLSGVAGELRVSPGGTVNATGIVIGSGGTVTVETGGQLNGAVTNLGGTLVTGSSPGTLHLDGLDLRGETLDVELAGLDETRFDRFVVDGPAAISRGHVAVSLLDGFTPKAGESFPFLSAEGGLAGAPDDLSVTVRGVGAPIDFGLVGTDGILSLAFGTAASAGDGLAFRGSAGDDVESGTEAADSFEGRGGNDTLMGGGGADRFLFRPGDGRDTITDFGPDDVLLLDPSSQVTIEESDGDTVVTVDSDDQIVLRDVTGLGPDAIAYLEL
jgi:VCBS repeat-containing protein